MTDTGRHESNPPGLTVRELLRNATTAALATVDADSGHPHTSLVLMATDTAGAPLLLLSDLAVHSKNLAQQRAVSLLISAPAGTRDPLTTARVSLSGELTLINDDDMRTRYLRRYPSAHDFVAFADFHFYRLHLTEAYLVAGFGAIHRLRPDEFLLSPEQSLDAATETDIIEHMNADHADAIQLLGNMILPAPYDMSAIDANGCDLRSGWDFTRILFEVPVTTAETARKELVRLVKRARN